MEFTVKVEDGEVFINGEFVRQLCWDNESVGMAVTAWLDGILEWRNGESAV